MPKRVFLVLTIALTACTLTQGLAGLAQTPAANSPSTPSSATAVPVLSSRTPAAAPATGPRRPRGIYAELHVDLLVAQQQKVNPSVTSDQIHSSLRSLYGRLLDNPALSGLAVGITWGRLNPNPPENPQPYDWSYLDDVFSSLAAWNSANPTQTPKTIQLQISAGFGSPQWVLDRIPSCDGLFASPPQTPPKDCGKATFQGFVEGGGGVLPMPWDPFYKRSFRTFLTAFAARYGSNPSLVSIDVSGPTAASSEMILPNNVNTPNQSQFGGLSPNEMWLRLLAFAYPGKPADQDSDQAFVDEWNAASDMFGEIFSGLTLVATTGSGLPNLGSRGFAVPAAFQPDCPVPDMDCAAEAAILSHFVDPTVGGANAKAVQSSGMKGFGRTLAYSLGVHGVEWLAQSTAGLSSPSAQVLGGEQFDTSAALSPVEEGCTSAFPPHPKGQSAGRTDAASVPVANIPADCLAPGTALSSLTGYGQFGNVPAKDLISPEQAIYNVLGVFFNGTPAGSSFGVSSGTAPYNYLQIYNQDIDYASAHAQAPAQVVATDGTRLTTTAQDLLNLASQKLLQMSEPGS